MNKPIPKVGLEIEYMVVCADSYNVLPISDRLIEKGDMEEGDRVLGPITISNELVSHVIELKGTAPIEDPERGLPAALPHIRAAVALVNSELSAHNALLVPGAVHPWMDPAVETRLWPHSNQEIYAAFDRIFNCKSHGWANLQSIHINLPFHTDEEFFALHAACRFILPILPALAASSPFVEGKRSDALDTRILFYGRNSDRFPSITGRVIPEPSHSPSEYHRSVLEKIYAELSEVDPEQILRYEWSNARGCIPRFERNTIEIRLLDAQECPSADLAIALLVTKAVEELASRPATQLRALNDYPTEALAQLLFACAKDAENTMVAPAYAAAVGVENSTPVRAGSLWDALRRRLVPKDHELNGPLEIIARDGTLATRMVKRAGQSVTRERLSELLSALGRCLSADQPL